jgi:hypothetical protein
VLHQFIVLEEGLPRRREAVDISSVGAEQSRERLCLRPTVGWQPFLDFPAIHADHPSRLLDFTIIHCCENVGVSSVVETGQAAFRH